MKIAIASQNKQNVTGHMGQCRKFWIYEMSKADASQPSTLLDKTLLELPKEQSFHNSSPQQPHPLDEVNVLISGGMGKGLARRLQNHGIDGVVTPETDPDQAVLAYLDGSLVRQEAGCQDHDHEHHHGHHHQHGQAKDHECHCNDD